MTVAAPCTLLQLIDIKLRAAGAAFVAGGVKKEKG